MKLCFGKRDKKEGLGDLFFFERDGALAFSALHFLQIFLQKSFFSKGNETEAPGS